MDVSVSQLSAMFIQIGGVLWAPADFHYISPAHNSGLVLYAILVFFENMAESIWAFLERNSRSRYSVYLLSNGSFKEVYRTEISWHLISAPVFLPLLSGRTENLPWRKYISKFFPLHWCHMSFIVYFRLRLKSGLVPFLWFLWFFFKSLMAFLSHSKIRNICRVQQFSRCLGSRSIFQLYDVDKYALWCRQM